MLRLIFDTNIYSSIAKDKDINKIVEKIKDEKEIKVYGYKIIKDEIKDIPKSIKYEKHKLRTFLINLYYDIIKEQYPESQNIKRLAEIYYKEFKKLGGKRSFNDLKNDFKIVACASIHKLDLIVSEDEKTLKGNIALKTYEEVNSRNSLRTPYFYSYKDLKKKIIGSSS